MATENELILKNDPKAATSTVSQCEGLCSQRERQQEAKKDCQTILVKKKLGLYTFRFTINIKFGSVRKGLPKMQEFNA